MADSVFFPICNTHGGKFCNMFFLFFFFYKKNTSEFKLKGWGIFHKHYQYISRQVICKSNFAIWFRIRSRFTSKSRMQAFWYTAILIEKQARKAVKRLGPKNVETNIAPKQLVLNKHIRPHPNGGGTMQWVESGMDMPFPSPFPLSF